MKFKKSYVVCATPRTGSTLLCNVLRSTELAGRPNEYFTPSEEPRFREKWGVASEFKEYFDRAITEATSRNGVCGFKIMMGQFFEFIERLRGIAAPEYQTLSEYELLHHFFPDLRYIWMTRRNKVRQAVSFSRAVQTQHWVKPHGSKKSQKEPRYRFGGIDLLMQRVTIYEAKWQEYFAHHDIQPLIVSYEDLVNSRQETVMQILRFIGVEVREDLSVQETMKKQADQLNEIWVERFIREKAAAIMDR